MKNEFEQVDINNNNHNEGNNLNSNLIAPEEEPLNVNELISDLASPIDAVLKKLGIKKETTELYKKTGDMNLLEEANATETTQNNTISDSDLRDAATYQYRRHKLSIIKASGAAEHIKTAFLNIQDLFSEIDKNIDLENQKEKSQDKKNTTESNFPVKSGKEEIVDEIEQPKKSVANNNVTSTTISATAQTSVYDDYQIISNNLEIFWKEREELNRIVLALKNIKSEPLEVTNIILETIYKIDKIFTDIFKTRFILHYLPHGNFTYVDFSCWHFGEINYGTETFCQDDDIYLLIQELLSMFENPNNYRLPSCLEKIVISDFPKIIKVPNKFIDDHGNSEEFLISVSQNNNEILPLRLVIGLFLNYSVYSSLKNLQIDSALTNGDLDVLLDKLKNHPKLQEIKLNSPVPLSYLNKLNDILKSNNHKLVVFNYIKTGGQINEDSNKSLERKYKDIETEEKYKIQIFPTQNSEDQIHSALQLHLERNDDYGKKIEDLNEKGIIYLKNLLDKLCTFDVITKDHEINFKWERNKALIMRYELLKGKADKNVHYKIVFFFDYLMNHLENVILTPISELIEYKLEEVALKTFKDSNLKPLIADIEKCNNETEPLYFERYALKHLQMLQEIISILENLIATCALNNNIYIKTLMQTNPLESNNIVGPKNVALEKKLMDILKAIDNFKVKITSLIADSKKVNDPTTIYLSTTNLLRFIYENLISKIIIERFLSTLKEKDWININANRTKIVSEDNEYENNELIIIFVEKQKKPSRGYTHDQLIHESYNSKTILFKNENFYIKIAKAEELQGTFNVEVFPASQIKELSKLYLYFTNFIHFNYDKYEDYRTSEINCLDQIKSLLYKAYKNEIETYIQLSFYKKSGKYDKQTANTIELSCQNGAFILNDNIHEYIQVQNIIYGFFLRQIWDAFYDKFKERSLDKNAIQILIRILIIPRDLSLLIHEMPDPPVQINNNKKIEQQKTIYSLKERYISSLSLTSDNGEHRFNVDLYLKGMSVQRTYINPYDYFYFYTNLTVIAFFAKIITLGAYIKKLIEDINKKYHDILSNNLKIFEAQVSEIPIIDYEFIRVAPQRIQLFEEARRIIETIITCLNAVGGAIDFREEEFLAAFKEDMEGIVDEDTPTAKCINTLKDFCYLKQVQLNLVYFYQIYFIYKTDALKYLNDNIKLFSEMDEKKIFHRRGKREYFDNNKFNAQFDLILITYFTYFDIIISSLEAKIANEQTLFSTIFNKDPTGFYEFQQNFYGCFYQKDLLALCYTVACFVFTRCINPEQFKNQSEKYNQEFTTLINLIIPLIKILNHNYFNSKRHLEIRIFFGYFNLFECLQYLLKTCLIRREQLTKQLDILHHYSQSISNGTFENNDYVKPYYEMANLLQIHNSKLTEVTRLSTALTRCVSQYSLDVARYFKSYYSQIFNLCLSISRLSGMSEMYKTIFNFFRSSVIHIINTNGVSNSDRHTDFINDISESGALDALLIYLQTSELKKINVIKSIVANLEEINEILAPSQKLVQSVNRQGFFNSNSNNNNSNYINTNNNFTHTKPKTPDLTAQPKKSALRKHVSFEDLENPIDKSELVKIKIILKLNSDEALFISGSDPKLGNWQTALRMTCVGGETWIIEIEKNLQNCEFKFLMGRYDLGEHTAVSNLAWEKGENHKLELDIISFNSKPCTFGRS